jgi:hypothetical protein
MPRYDDMQMQHSRELLTIEEYVTLSAKINYQLSSRSLNRPALLALVLGPAELSPANRALMLEGFDVLQAGYRDDRRRLGTLGILHPLRAAAILSRTMEAPTIVHLLAALYHDKEEDLTEKELGADRFRDMQGKYEKLLVNLAPDDATRLAENIGLLSNQYDSYEHYLNQVLDAARTRPELLHVKLSDRLDNTFDIHLQHPGISGYNFYRAVFDILFLPRFTGVEMGNFHFMPDVQEGVMLLSQLFKDLIFLNLLRIEKLDRADATTHRLFIGLGVAGIREAQWLALEMFNTVIKDVTEQRALLTDVMGYCTSGGIDSVTTAGAGHELDGMLLTLFRAQLDGTRKQMLKALFEDRHRLARMVLTFIVVFASFINDPTYAIRGIDREGVHT